MGTRGGVLDAWLRQPDTVRAMDAISLGWSLRSRRQSTMGFAESDKLGWIAPFDGGNA